MKSRRLAILKEINKLKCNCYAYDKTCAICCQLRECGRKLLALGKESELRKLKTELVDGKIITPHKIITAAEYSTLLNQGRTRKSLAIEYNTSEQKLYRWEKANNIKMPRQLKLTVQQYLDAKAKDLLDKEIAELFNVSPSHERRQPDCVVIDWYFWGISNGDDIRCNIQRPNHRL